MATPVDRAAITAVMRQFDTPAEPDVCEWVIYTHVTDSAYLVIQARAEPGFARTMPGNATRQLIARSVTYYAASLSEAGFGTAYWLHHEMRRLLVVASNQAECDRIAPAVLAELTQLNPEPAPADRREGLF